jgi:hypothetical protein
MRLVRTEMGVLTQGIVETSSVAFDFQTFIAFTVQGDSAVPIVMFGLFAHVVVLVANICLCLLVLQCFFPVVITVAARVTKFQFGYLIFADKTHIAHKKILQINVNLPIKLPFNFIRLPYEWKIFKWYIICKF